MTEALQTLLTKALQTLVKSPRHKSSSDPREKLLPWGSDWRWWWWWWWWWWWRWWRQERRLSQWWRVFVFPILSWTLQKPAIDKAFLLLQWKCRQQDVLLACCATRAWSWLCFCLCMNWPTSPPPGQTLGGSALLLVHFISQALCHGSPPPWGALLPTTQPSHSLWNNKLWWQW